MRSRLPALALTLALSVGGAPPAPAQSILLPDIGNPDQQYLSATDERRLGLAVLQRVRNRGFIIDDIQVSEYLASVGQRIAAYAQNNGNPFVFFGVNDTAINAFAMPGGFIGVNSGLLLATQSEDELAGVLAHEIAHISQGHIARTFAEAQRLNLSMAAALIASLLLAATTDSSAGSAAMMGTLAAGTQRQINFTRANEQEADRLGTQLLRQSGFDPNGLAGFFARLERLSGHAATKLPEYLLTHPLPRNRIADTLDRFGGAPPARRAPGDDLAYPMIKARLQVLTNPNTQDLLRAFAAGNRTPAGRYGYALALKRAGRYPEARQQIMELRRNDPDRLLWRIEDAEIALAQGERDRAWQVFEEAGRLYPNDFTLAMHYGQALASQGDPRRALRLLQPFLQSRPDNAQLYALYAQAAQRAGDIVTAHATLAEYYYLSGELDQAIEQAELGLAKPGATAYQQAQLRARLRRFQEEKLAARR